MIACYLINRMTSAVFHVDIPFWRLCPDHSTFHLLPCVFRSVYFMQILTLSHDKLSPKALTCVFVGYSKTQKGIGAMILHQESTIPLLISLSLSPHFILVLHNPLILLVQFLFLCMSIYLLILCKGLVLALLILYRCILVV